MVNTINSASRAIRKPLLGVMAVLLSCGLGVQAAQPSPDAAPPADARLQAAQARLEAAAREVAELSAQGGKTAQRIEMRIQRSDGPGPMAGPGGMDGKSPMIVRMGPPGMSGMSGMPEGHPPLEEGFHRMDGPGAAGLRLAPMSPRLAGYFGAKAGVLVVKADNPALKLEDGDVITSIGGRTPSSPMQALRIFRSYEQGEKVPLQLLRDRKSLSIEVTVPLRREVRRFELRVPRPDATTPMQMPPPPAPPAHQH